MRFVIIAAMIASAACATSSSDPVNDSAAARLAGFDRTGDKDSCLSLARLSELVPVDESTLLVRAGVNTWYVSDLPRRCRGVVSRGNRIEYTTSLTQLCRGDILRIVDNAAGFLAGSCAMGAFERLEPKADAE